MNIELNPAPALPVSGTPKTSEVQNNDSSNFLDTLLKIAQESLPVPETVSAPQPDIVEVKLSALFDRSSDFFNFVEALSSGPFLNFLDVIFTDSSSIQFPLTLPADKTKGNPKGIPFINIFAV